MPELILRVILHNFIVFFGNDLMWPVISETLRIRAHPLIVSLKLHFPSTHWWLRPHVCYILIRSGRQRVMVKGVAVASISNVLV